MPAVTATANQNRTEIGSVQNNKASVALSSASALATAITRRVPASGMESASVSAPILSVLTPMFDIVRSSTLSYRNQYVWVTSNGNTARLHTNAVTANQAAHAEYLRNVQASGPVVRVTKPSCKPCS